MNSNMLSALMNMGHNQSKTPAQITPPIDPEKMKQMIPISSTGSFARNTRRPNRTRSQLYIKFKITFASGA